ncbi:MAG: phospho-N-acetylmuramoyl-pentapeptide-transferase [Pseudobutyrivibrio sp.]|nr:phospho-N-acetylmuramoyl-pentapeptide-transferase [Pseudobutyrivibrio sp.]
MTEVFLPLIMAFLIAIAISPACIPILRRLKMGNTEREELKSHQKKSGTPSMGGVIFLIAVSVVGFFFAKTHPHIYPVLYVTLAFGFIGFLDDLLKALKRKSDGLLAWQKMLLQIAVTTGFVVYMYMYSDISMEIIVPISRATVDIGWLGIVIMYLCVLGTVNGANFTDGLDGLATTVTMVIVAFLGIASIHFGSDITPVMAAMVGALMGFLMYNVHPAQIFMGDTGSLALGGFVVSSAYMLQMPIFIIIICLIYLAEVLSVIMQVGYFKATHGKRIFRMAPIHHHFELGGWSEVKVVAVFSCVTVMLCVLAYYML